MSRLMSPKLFLMSATALCLGLALQARADEAALYDLPHPDDASYVRFVGFDDADSAEFAGVSFPLSAKEQAAYFPISAARLRDVDAGDYVTVMATPEGPRVITEEPRANRAKVHLFLVNGSDQALELRLADGSTGVIDAVAPGASGRRAVNPVSVALGVFAPGDDTAMATFDVALRRGQNVSLIADDAGVRLVPHRFTNVMQ